jgi:hypothetical protein
MAISAHACLARRPQSHKPAAGLIYAPDWAHWPGLVVHQPGAPSSDVSPPAKQPSLRIEIVKRSDDMKRFVVLPRRWVVV